MIFLMTSTIRIAPPSRAVVTRLVLVTCRHGTVRLRNHHKLVLNVHYASKFETPCHAGVFLEEALVAVPNDAICAMLRLIGY